MSVYGRDSNSAITNAPAPISGGMICPPVEATASMAPARLRLKPRRFIRGMVSTPVLVTLATVLPFTMPMKALPNTATMPAPPRMRPPMRMAIMMKT